MSASTLSVVYRVDVDVRELAYLALQIDNAGQLANGMGTVAPNDNQYLHDLVHAADRFGAESHGRLLAKLHKLLESEL